MKKYQKVVTGAMLLCGLFCGAAMVEAAEAIYVKGNVQVMSSTDGVWKTLEKGMQVDIGDSIRTARRSEVDIALDAEKKNTIRLGEKTLVVLNTESDDQIDRLNLSRGRVYSNMENIKEGLSFEVTTPSAVAGVRGSSYMVYSEVDSDEVSAYKDTVFVKTFDAEKNQLSDIMLPQGFKTFIDRFESPGALSQISMREFDRFDNIKEDLTSRAEGRERVESEGARRLRESVQEKAAEAVEQTGVIEEVVDTLKEATDDSNTEKKIEELRTVVEEEPQY